MKNYWVFKQLADTAPLISALKLQAQDARMKALALLPKGVCLIRHGDMVIPVRAGAFHLDALVYSIFVRAFCMMYPGPATSALGIDIGRGTGLIYLREMRMQCTESSMMFLRGVYQVFDSLMPANNMARASAPVKTNNSLTYSSLLRKLSYPAGSMFTFPRNAVGTPAHKTLDASARGSLSVYAVQAISQAQVPDETKEGLCNIDHLLGVVESLEVIGRNTFFATTDAQRLDLVKGLADDLGAYTCENYVDDQLIEVLPQSMFSIRTVGFFLRALCDLYSRPQGKRDAFVERLILEAADASHLFARADSAVSPSVSVAHAVYSMLSELGVDTKSDMLSSLYADALQHDYEPLTALFTAYSMFVVSTLYPMYHYVSVISSDKGARGASRVMSALEVGSASELRDAVREMVEGIASVAEFEVRDADTGEVIDDATDIPNPFDGLLEELAIFDDAKVRLVAQHLLLSMQFPYTSGPSGEAMTKDRMTNIVGLTAKAVAATSVTTRHLFSGNHVVVTPSCVYAPRDVFRSWVVASVAARNVELDTVKMCVEFFNNLADIPNVHAEAPTKNDRAYSPFAFKNRELLAGFLYPHDTLDPLTSMLNSL